MQTRITSQTCRAFYSRRIWVRSIITNDSLDVATTRAIKAKCGSAIGPGVEALLLAKAPFMTALTGPDRYPVLPQTELTYWRVPYPVCRDLNNLSFVTFLNYGHIHAVFSGDLEQGGWEALLMNPYFRRQLGPVNAFVASHHGRENGFHADLFRYCRPEIVIASDGPIRHASQETVRRYRAHTSGVLFGSERRHVLTTRCDGTIRISESISARTGAWVHVYPGVDPRLD